MRKKIVVKGKRKKSKFLDTFKSPRLYVFRSNNHIYAQVIDNTTGYTLLTVSTLDSSIKALSSSRATCQSAQKVGELIAKKALGKGIKSVVFDRGKYLYHGRIKALADSARQEGLIF